jgi:hypothetical protein
MRYNITRDHRDQARDCAEQRQEYNDRKKNRDTYGLKTDREGSLRINRMGCLGELVVAEILGEVWHKYSEDPQGLPGDVGTGIQVRTTKRRTGGLFLHPRDKDDHAFVLVRVPKMQYPDWVEVVGWTYGRDGKQQEFWTEPQPGRPCFEYPARLLNPDLSEIPYLTSA